MSRLFRSVLLCVSSAVVLAGGSAAPAAAAATTAPPVLHVGEPQITAYHGGGVVGAPSCPTTTYCVAGEPSGTVQTWDGSTWSEPVLVDETDPNLNPKLVVECPTTTLCVGADAEMNSFVRRGTVWSSAGAIGDSSGGGLRQLSCGSSTFCVALDVSGRSMTFNGGSWSAPVDSGMGVNAELSCTGPNFCMGLSGPNSYTFDGERWSGPISLADASPAGHSQWDHISCASATFCRATQYFGYVAAYNGVRWALLGRLPSSYSIHGIQCPSAKFCAVVATQDRNSDGNVYFSLIGHAFGHRVILNYGALNFGGVTCLSATFCIADPGGVKATDDQHTSVWDGQRWQRPDPVPFVGTGTRDAISCATTTACVAVADDGTAQSWNGASWSPPLLIDSVAAYGLTAVSCASADMCVATDRDGNALVLHGRTWSLPAAVSPAILSALDCVTTTYCVAVDLAGAVRTFDGATWSAPTTIDPDGGLVTVSCPTTTFCAAGDDVGNVLTLHGSTWSAPLKLALVVPNVSCPTTTFCAAGLTGADDAGVSFYNGSTWTAGREFAEDTVDTLLDCPSSQWCVAGTGDGLETLTTTTAAPAVYADPRAAAVRPTAISCPSTSFCAASYAFGASFATT